MLSALFFRTLISASVPVCSPPLFDNLFPLVLFSDYVIYSPPT